MEPKTYPHSRERTPQPLQDGGLPLQVVRSPLFNASEKRNTEPRKRKLHAKERRGDMGRPVPIICSNFVTRQPVQGPVRLVDLVPVVSLNPSAPSSVFGDLLPNQLEPAIIIFNLCRRDGPCYNPLRQLNRLLVSSRNYITISGRDCSHARCKWRTGPDGQSGTTIRPLAGDMAGCIQCDPTLLNA